MQPASCRLTPSKGLQQPRLPVEADFATHQVSLGTKGREGLLFSWTGTSAQLRMLLLLPFGQRKSVPITLQQERAECSGPFDSAEHSRCCLPELCPQSRADGSLLLGQSPEEPCSLVP